MTKRKKKAGTRMKSDVDFPGVLEDLQKWGMSIVQIAADVRCTRAFLYQIKAGHRSHPNYTIGARLVRLWKQEYAKRKPKF